MRINTNLLTGELSYQVKKLNPNALIHPLVESAKFIESFSSSFKFLSITLYTIMKLTKGIVFSE